VAVVKLPGNGSRGIGAVVARGGIGAGLFPGRSGYRRFVAEGVGRESPWIALRGQIYLGGEAFLERMARRLPRRRDRGISRSHFEPTRPEPAPIEAGVAKAYQ
jgi:hypothetical protein